MRPTEMLTIQKSITEQEILAGCRNGNARFQRLLYDRFAAKMLGVCVRYVKDKEEAEHVMIGGMVKVFEKIGQFNEEGSFEGWIRRIMVNESLMYIRKNKNMSLMVDIETTSGNEPSEDQIATLEIEEVIGMIHDLPIGYRTVFNLYAIEGYSHAEIAAMLGINENTSKSQLSRARKYLQARMEQQNEVKIEKIIVKP